MRAYIISLDHFIHPVIPLKETLRHTQGDKMVIVAQVEEREFYNLKREGGQRVENRQQ